MTNDLLGILENAPNPMWHTWEYVDNSENNKAVNKIQKVQAGLLRFGTYESEKG